MKKSVKLSFYISFAVFLAVCVLFYYMDLKTLTVWTVNIWDTFLETGTFREYYAYSARNLHDLPHAMVGSDILIYMPWAIWNLPIWALQRFAGLAITEHWWMILYSKAFILGVFGLILSFTGRVAREICDDKNACNKTVYMCATSAFALWGIAYGGQNDVLVILPFLYAVYMLMRGRKTSFLIYAGISVMLKPYYLLAIIPLILLKEKKLWKAAGQIIFTVLFYFLQKLIFIGAPMYAESMSYGPAEGLFALFTASELPVSVVPVSLFAIAYGVVCVSAYLNDGSKNEKESILFYIIVPFLVMFGFCGFDFYRTVYLVPFLYLFMLAKKDRGYINGIIECGIAGILLFYFLTCEELFFSGRYLFDGIEGALPFCLWYKDAVGIYAYNILFAVFLVFIGGFIYVNRPGYQTENKVLLLKEESWVYWIRTLINGVALICGIAGVIL